MNTIKQITEENGKGIHSMFNACMHKAECCSKDDVIADLKRQFEDAKEQADIHRQWNLGYMKSNDDHRTALLASLAREARLRGALEFLNARIITTDLGGVVEKALTLPHDDTALREYRDAVIEECIATTNQVLDGLEDADNVADALHFMKGAA